MELEIPKGFKNDPLFKKQFIEDYRGLLHSLRYALEVWVPVKQDDRGTITYVPLEDYHEATEIYQRHDC